MALTVDSLVRISAAGGGLILDSKGFTVDSLVRIAAATKTKGAKLTILNVSGLTVDSMVRISAAGDGNVIFDTTKQMPAANSGFALWGLTSFVKTFVQGSTFELRMNISAENPPQRKAANRYSAQTQRA